MHPASKKVQNFTNIIINCKINRKHKIIGEQSIIAKQSYYDYNLYVIYI